MNKHKTIIHTRCPYAPVWDYYRVTITTDQFIQSELLQDVCDTVRGKELTQEAAFDAIYEKLPKGSTMKMVGSHGQNGRLVVQK